MSPSTLANLSLPLVQHNLLAHFETLRSVPGLDATQFEPARRLIAASPTVKMAIGLAGMFKARLGDCCKDMAKHFVAEGWVNDSALFHRQYLKSRDVRFAEASADVLSAAYFLEPHLDVAENACALYAGAAALYMTEQNEGWEVRASDVMAKMIRLSRLAQDN